MSSFAYHNSMPSRLAIVCPVCIKQAKFEFAEWVRVKTRLDAEWFTKSPHFDYLKVDGHDGQKHAVAIHYHGLITQGLPDIDDLPDGYAISEWDHPPHKLRFVEQGHGTLICASCGARRRHVLDWPEEAFFKIDYRGQSLWAFDRQSATELCAYIGAAHRDTSDYEYWPFLMKIPKLFLTRNARETVVKRLEKTLKAKAGYVRV